MNSAHKVIAPLSVVFAGVLVFSGILHAWAFAPATPEHGSGALPSDRIPTTNHSESLESSVALLASAFLWSADVRLMGKVGQMSDGHSKLLQLRPVSFRWNAGPRKGEEDIGFLAQEVEQVVPEVVYTDRGGTKSIEYAKLIPILVNAVQVQQADIDELKAEIDEMRRTSD